MNAKKNLTRRNFIKNSAIMGTGLTLGAPLLLRCASTMESGPVHYPKLPGQKIQSPEHYGLEGCMIGYYPGSVTARYPEHAISYTGNKVGKSPSILHLNNRRSRIPHGIYNSFTDSMIQTANFGVIPFVSYDGRYGDEYSSSNILKEIIKGKHNVPIRDSATKLREKYGEIYGGFFIQTLREMNMPHTWPPWGGRPREFKKAWKHIWKIFDDEGASKYATWVWSPYVSSDRVAESPDRYYPGDHYVDWIGLNGYNFWGQAHPGGRFYQSFSYLFERDYYSVLKNYPDKPMMIAATGTDENKYKPEWIAEAFSSLRDNFKGIKAVCWWDIHWSHGPTKNFDSRIDSSPEALQAYREGISDPHFLGKVPYRKN